MYKIEIFSEMLHIFWRIQQRLLLWENWQLFEYFKNIIKKEVFFRGFVAMKKNYIEIWGFLLNFQE